MLASGKNILANDLAAKQKMASNFKQILYPQTDPNLP